MSIKTPFLKEKVRHVGTFDLKETYRLLFEWLISKDYTVDETNYDEIIGTGGMKEVSIRWTALRTVTAYFQYEFKIWFHPLAMTSVEVENNGVKQKLNKGDLTIEFGSSLIRDHKNQFEDDSFGKSLRNFYDQYLVRNRIEAQEGKLAADFEEMITQTKEILLLTATR
jgi:hypothetical protein